MMMEGGGLVQQRREISNVIGNNGRKAMKRKILVRRRTVKIRRRRNALQDLYESCLDVFKGPGTVPSAMDVQKLCNILDNMKPEDVGLSKDLPFFQNNGACKGIPKVTNTTIYQCNDFSLCIFFLPATAVIPLHNHPGMTVFSKLLWGTMHIKSYDWDDDPEPRSNQSRCEQNMSAVRLARLEADSVFTAPCSTSVLYPTTGGNIHQFRAITPCAVLDVMGPPYSQEHDRDCSYYRDLPSASFPRGECGECYGWLEEIEAPEGSRMDVIEYLGPQVVDTIRLA